ncbi:MAG: hypothetical protein OXC02_03755 [Rhodobacteraceae bacterium]|nr:hypothetical protein [Paracoccaceae bacterium]
MAELLAEKCGWEIIADDNEIIDIFVRVDKGETDYEELASWFRVNLRRPV